MESIKTTDGRVFSYVGDPEVHISQGGALLGKGGQAAVYKVKDVTTDEFFALTVYRHPINDAETERVRFMVENGTPNASFVWPLALIESDGSLDSGYGCITQMQDKGYTSYVKLMTGKAYFPSKEKQILALIDMVSAFEALHAKGFCYHDLNDSHVLFDCQQGKVLLCGMEAIAPQGLWAPIDDEGNCIRGKLQYMAPEVAIDMIPPDAISDRFSMAVLMFMLLTRAHPLDGVARLQGQMTPSLQRKIYGTEPVFIFDPNNASNRPDPQIDANATLGWNRLPDFIQNLFIRALTSGLPAVGKTKDQLETERQSRPSEREWRMALHKWMDTLAKCPDCGCWLNVNLSGHDILPTTCPYCGKNFNLKLPVLVIKKNNEVVRCIVLDEGKEIPKCSVIGEASNDTAIAVMKSKKAANVYGLFNKLDIQWKCTQVGAKDKLVDTGGVVAALDGVYIEFDYTFSGEIHKKQ